MKVIFYFVLVMAGVLIGWASAMVRAALCVNGKTLIRHVEETYTDTYQKLVAVDTAIWMMDRIFGTERGSDRAD